MPWCSVRPASALLLLLCESPLQVKASSSWAAWVSARCPSCELVAAFGPSTSQNLARLPAGLLHRRRGPWGAGEASLGERISGGGGLALDTGKLIFQGVL